MAVFSPLGRPLGARRRVRLTPPRSVVPRGVRRAPRRSLPYEVVRQQVLAAIEQLPPDERAQIPSAGTLPEIMVAFALLRAHFLFEMQISEDGGRLRLGGAVVDFKVYVGARPVIVRVQGDYWHGLPDRRLKDAVQYERLKAMGYLVADIWESDIYHAWMDGVLVQFVTMAVLQAI